VIEEWPRIGLSAPRDPGKLIGAESKTATRRRIATDQGRKNGPARDCGGNWAAKAKGKGEFNALKKLSRAGSTTN
jgi:hypothetical protein